MKTLSVKQEDKYRTININANMDNFFKAEEKSLFTQCNTLISFIKFIQTDSSNGTKLRNVSKAILELQKEFWIINYSCFSLVFLVKVKMIYVGSKTKEKI